MRSLNPDQIRTLLEITELGSLTAAARRLNVTQPAISLQVRELEQRLGVRLVERLGKRAFATAAGREVIEHARRIFVETEALTVAMRTGTVAGARPAGHRSQHAGVAGAALRVRLLARSAPD